MSDPNENLAELRKISKILLLAHASVIESELSKIATSEDRKRMWVLIDGIRRPKDIANQLKITERAVRYFLDGLAAAGFIENQRGEPPKRILDYVPPSWIGLVQVEEKKEGEAEPSKSVGGESNA
jgi:DNA-binding MarR family transcriptional regulator